MAEAAIEHFDCITEGLSRRLDMAGVDKPKFFKDILRVGTWITPTQYGKQPWHVTPAKLLSIVANFDRFIANGNEVPWKWEHEGGAKDRIGYVRQLQIKGETLYAIVEAENAERVASFGSNAGDETNDRVSVHVEDKLDSDGKGNSYVDLLMHVANVDHAVVTNQGPFRRLSFSRKGSTVAKDKSSDSSGDGAGADTFSIDEVKKMLADAGYAVPDIATTKESVMASFMALTGGESVEDPAADDASGIPPLPMDGNMASLDGASPRTLKMWLKQSTRQLSIVNREKAAIEAARTADAKAAYEADVELLLTDNKITPADKPDLIESGKSCGWKLSMLAPFKRLAGTATNQDPSSRRLSANGGNGVVKESKPGGVHQLGDDWEARAARCAGKPVPKAKA